MLKLKKNAVEDHNLLDPAGYRPLTEINETIKTHEERLAQLNEDTESQSAKISEAKALLEEVERLHYRPTPQRSENDVAQAERNLEKITKEASRAIKLNRGTIEEETDKLAAAVSKRDQIEAFARALVKRNIRKVVTDQHVKVRAALDALIVEEEKLDQYIRSTPYRTGIPGGGKYSTFTTNNDAYASKRNEQIGYNNRVLAQLKSELEAAENEVREKAALSEQE